MPSPPGQGRGLFGNSFALLATTHITAVLGYVFWTLCARLFSPTVIGVTNIVISAMTLVAIVAVSGFIPLLTRLLPGASHEERSGLCSTAFVVTAVVSCGAGIVAAYLLPRRVHAEISTGWLVGLLSSGTVGTAMLLVTGAALLGVRRAELSLIANVVGAAVRLVAIVTIVTLGALAAGADIRATHTILIVWVASLMISVLLSLWLLIRAQPDFHFHAHRIWLSRMKDSLGWDHVATLTVRAPPLVIPILAAALLPPAQVGYLAVVAMIPSAFLAVASAVSNALLADCADSPARLQTQARRATRLIGLLLIAPVLITCLLAKDILSVFGAGYANYSPLLIVLLLSTFPDAVINVAVAILRVQGRLPVVAALTASGATISVGGAWLLMTHLGVFGAGLAVVVSQTIVATACAVVGPHRRTTGVPTGVTAIPSSETIGTAPRGRHRISKANASSGRP